MTAHELTAWRTAHGLSRTKLAKALGTRYLNIYRYEEGKRAIPPTVAKCLELLSREDSIKKLLTTP